MSLELDLISTREAAELLGIRPGTLHHWRLDFPERIPFYKFGEGKTCPIRYKRQDVLAYIERMGSQEATTVE